MSGLLEGKEQGKEPGEGRGCEYLDMADDLVRLVVEWCRGWPEGDAGNAEGVVRLVGAGSGKTKGGGCRSTVSGGRVCMCGGAMRRGCGGNCGA